MDWLFEFYKQHQYESGIIFLALLLIGMTAIRTLREYRALAAAKRLLADPVPPPPPAPEVKKYDSYDEFRRDLLNDDVPVHEVFARCGGVVPPKRPHPSQKPKTARFETIPGTTYVVKHNPVTGLWDVILIGRLGATAVASSHVNREDALKRIALYNGDA